MLAPGVSLAGISLGAEPLPSDRVCAIYALGSSSGSSRVLLVACQYEVARERAVAWSRALLGQVAAAHVLVLGAIPAEQFRGQGALRQGAGGDASGRTGQSEDDSTVCSLCGVTLLQRQCGGALGVSTHASDSTPQSPSRPPATIPMTYHNSCTPHPTFCTPRRPPGDASQEELLFLLRTRAAAAAAAAVGRPAAPLLPTGTVVGGLPAALLSHCQVGWVTW